MKADTQKQIDRAELKDLRKNRKKVKANLSDLEKDCRSEEQRLNRLLAAGRERARRALSEIDARINIVEGRLQ